MAPRAATTIPMVPRAGGGGAGARAASVGQRLPDGIPHIDTVRRARVLDNDKNVTFVNIKYTEIKRPHRVLTGQWTVANAVRAEARR